MEAEAFPTDKSLEDETRLVKDLIEGILKAKKLLKFYPSNNPIYISASKEVYYKFHEVFKENDAIALQISMTAIAYKKQQVYDNPQKDGNIAFLFFKDGVKEIRFLKGIDQKELEEFMKILNMDFATEDFDDDLVTLLWTGEFEHIKYIVDEDFLGDWNESDHDEITDNALAAAHRDALQKSIERSSISIHLNDADSRYIANEIRQQSQPKFYKIVTIVFELLYLTKEPSDIKKIVQIIEDIIENCLVKGDFEKASYVLDMVKYIIEDKTSGDNNTGTFMKIHDAINSGAFIEKIIETLEGLPEIDKIGFEAYIKHLDKRSIPSFMPFLGQPKSRPFLIDALIILGQHNAETVSRGLQDRKWDIARSTALILGKIASPESIKYLTKALSYPDHRVRREVINAMDNIKSPETISYLKNTLYDENKSVRLAAAKTLGNIKTEEVKKVLLDELSGKDFLTKDFPEKREFYRIIAQWYDQEVKDFLIKTLNKKKFLKRTKNNESRACAAYALGIIDNKDSIKSIEGASKSKNKILKAMSIEALNRLKN
jgi:hypothetical protein